MTNQNIALLGDQLLGEQWMTLVQPKIPQLIKVQNLGGASAETRRAAFSKYDFKFAVRPLLKLGAVFLVAYEFFFLSTISIFA